MQGCPGSYYTARDGVNAGQENTLCWKALCKKSIALQKNPYHSARNKSLATKARTRSDSCSMCSPTGGENLLVFLVDEAAPAQQPHSPDLPGSQAACQLVSIPVEALSHLLHLELTMGL